MHRVTYLVGLYGLFAGQSKLFDGLANSLGYESVYHYALVIDAGSTGSRVHAFKFRVPFTFFGPPNLDLVEEFFAQVKPGLSSYADDPAQGAATIVGLIKQAEFLTPPEKRSDTPLIVRATAGLRLLPEKSAQALIDAVAIACSKLGYSTASDFVEIMEGADEGIFIWYTLNLLHNLINSETMAALDLGGGSTQITYQLNDWETKNYPLEDQFVVSAGGNNVTLYTHSYQNLGVRAARHGVFRAGAKGDDTHEFISVCVEPIIQKKVWVYGNKKYVISGAPRDGLSPAKVYARCHDLVKKYVLETMDWEPTHAPRGSVAGMSSFYYAAADAGLIDENGGTISVAQYRSGAIKACSANNVDQPWACFELVYIVTLLQDGYKLRDSELITLFKKVAGHEASWALGLAYTTVMNKISWVP